MAKKKKEDTSEDLIEGIEGILSSDLLGQIHKKHGKSILGRASDSRVLEVPRLPTGIFPLDCALGGGFPIGRVNLVFGHKSSAKTTLVLKSIAQAQRTCRNCFTVKDPETENCSCGEFRGMVTAFIDVEGAFDARWAASQGVDLSNLLLSVPEYAEQSIDICDALLRSGKCDVVALDSIAFLVPMKEIEEATEKETMGVQARLVGRGVRKFVSALNIMGNETGRRPTLFLINQIRNKLGVMYGCFHEDTKVVFADGAQHRIRDVVEAKMSGPVLSLCPDGKIRPKEITDWFYNGDLDEGENWITFKTSSAGGPNGVVSFTCTPGHSIVRVNDSLSEGYEFVPASEVRLGDKLLSWDLVGAEYQRQALEVGYKEEGSSDKYQSRKKYDLEVDGGGTYLAGGSYKGVFVHNSPDLCPGGFAPGFASSVEVKCFPGKYEVDKESGVPLYGDFRCKTVKNKVFTSGIECEYRMALSISDTHTPGQVMEEDGLFSQAAKLGVIERNGAMWELLGERYRSRDLVKAALRENADLKHKLKTALMQIALSIV